MLAHPRRRTLLEGMYDDLHRRFTAEKVEIAVPPPCPAWLARAASFRGALPTREGGEGAGPSDDALGEARA
jgi:hypothetical protein